MTTQVKKFAHWLLQYCNIENIFYRTGFEDDKIEHLNQIIIIIVNFDDEFQNFFLDLFDQILLRIGNDHTHKGPIEIFVYEVEDWKIITCMAEHNLTNL